MRLHRFLATSIAALLLSAGIAASGPTFWTMATSSEALRGTSDGVFVGLDGVLTPGPQLTSRLSASSAQIWSLAAAPDGSLWAGTGGDGKLLHLRPGQPEETAAATDEASVFAIAVTTVRVYFATSPDGKVYVYEGTGPARVFFDPKEKYIWALAVDGAGRLWVGAGSPAAIYRVDASGNGQVVYRPPAAHVVSLVADSSGRMMAGTESPGRLYRFDSSDRPFVMVDSGLTELRAIANGPSGSVFAAAISKGDDSTPAASGESASVALALPPPAATPGAATSGASSGARRSTILRIDATGSWDTFWETSDVIYDLAVDRDGNLLVASGSDGRLYRLDPNQKVQLFTGVDAKQITRLATGPSGAVAFATANPGRVISIGSGSQPAASYVSPVRDTHSSSTWGTIRWQASGQVSLYTRAGNTDKPDDSWSDWSGPYTHRDGEMVKSAPARFLQWKAVFQAAGPPPSLSSVTVAYLTRNSRPVVSSVTVFPPGVVFQRPFSSDEGAIAGMDDATADARRPAGADQPVPPPGRRMYQKGLQTISWKADDADGDRLSYTLYYRREGESIWRPLKPDWNDTIYVWDTTNVADGRYTVRIVASDLLSNSTDRALAGDRESDPFDVDNTPPTMTMEVSRQAGSVHLLVHAHDAQSPIDKLEYSLGGGRWQIVYPVDGVGDSPDERYDIPVPSEADLPRLVVRVTDALQNVATMAAPIR